MEPGNHYRAFAVVFLGTRAARRRVCKLHGYGRYKQWLYGGDVHDCRHGRRRSAGLVGGIPGSGAVWFPQARRLVCVLRAHCCLELCLVGMFFCALGTSAAPVSHRYGDQGLSSRHGCEKYRAFICFSIARVFSRTRLASSAISGGRYFINSSNFWSCSASIFSRASSC